jgi:hypothetical protein
MRWFGSASRRGLAVAAMVAMTAFLLACGGPALAEEGIEVAPRGVYSMGTAPLGEPLTLTFRIRNPVETQPMKIRSFLADAPGFAVEPPAETIPPGETVSFRVTLLATEAGDLTLPVAAYLEPDPALDIDPLIDFLIEGRVIGPDGP